MSSPFAPGKLRDFFKYYDDKIPQHREAAKALEVAMRRDAPQLLADEADWAKIFRKGAEAEKPPAPKPVVRSVNLKGRVKILAQPTSTTCGVTSCAMAVNTITGTDYNGAQWDQRHRNRYGVDLLSGLAQDCPRHKWRDAGRPRPAVWTEVLESLAAGCPAVCGVNGPNFSSGAGHIVAIIGVTTTTVIFADPNGGELRELPREAFENAAEYPQGNFIFLATPK